MHHFEWCQALDEQSARGVDSVGRVCRVMLLEMTRQQSIVQLDHVEQAEPHDQHFAAELVRGEQRRFFESREAVAQQSVVRAFNARHDLVWGAMDECWHDQRFHFLAITVVPIPGAEQISKSSMSRFTPGSPSPRRPDVENPS